MEDEKGFSKLRSLFWPLRRHEMKSFLPMLLLFFLIAFNYHLLKILKDTLIITAKGSGAEVIPFLKVWAILPSAILFTFLFTKLSSKFNRENIFYVMMGIFLSFFVIFIFFLYPNRSVLTLNSFSDSLALKLPSGFNGFILIVRYWHLSLFYIMAEAWSTMMLSLLLWILVVDVLSIGQAKRYYAFFGTSRNLAGIISGLIGQYLATKALASSTTLNYFSKLCGCHNAWDQTMLVFMISVIVCGVMIMGIYRYLHLKVYPKRYLIGGDVKNKGKQKISLKQSISYVVKSKYVLYIALIVLSYNVLINLTEILWKSQIKELHPSPSAFTGYTSKITYLIGIIATLSSFFLSGNLIRKLGWRKTALITPAALMITGLGFFYFLFMKRFADTSTLAIGLFGLSPLVLTVFFGSLQNIFSRAFKYTVFDDTKEMAFIPLTPSEKLQGKAAIDGIGSRLGKSGSSFLMQILFLLFATPMGASPFIFGITLLILPIWILSINKVSKKFEEKTATAPDDLESASN